MPTDTWSTDQFLITSSAGNETEVCQIEPLLGCLRPEPPQLYMTISGNWRLTAGKLEINLAEVGFSYPNDQQNRLARGLNPLIRG